MPQQCPNCQKEVPDGAKLCPNCGANVLPPVPVPFSSFTGSAVSDYILGVLAAIVGLFGAGIGILAVLAIAAFFIEKSRYFFRGVMTVVGILLLLILGIFIACSRTSI